MSVTYDSMRTLRDIVLGGDDIVIDQGCLKRVAPDGTIKWCNLDYSFTEIELISNGVSRWMLFANTWECVVCEIDMATGEIISREFMK